MKNIRVTIHLIGLVIFAQALGYISARSVEIHPIFESAVWRFALAYVSGLVLTLLAMRFIRCHLPNDLEFGVYPSEPELKDLTQNLLLVDAEAIDKKIKLIDPVFCAALRDYNQNDSAKNFARIRRISSLMCGEAEKAKKLVAEKASFEGGENVDKNI